MQGSSRGLVVAVIVLVLGALALWQLGSDPDTAPDAPGDPSKVPAANEVDSPKSVEDPETRREKIDGGQPETDTTPATSGDTEGSLLLRVIYAADKSAAVDFGVRLRESSKYGSRPKYASHRTDQNGEIRVTGLHPGKIVVSSDVDAMQYKVAKIEAGKETEFVYELKDGITLTGIVVDPDGVPVPGAEIVLCGWASRDARSVARTNAKGRFRMREVSRTVNVGARAPGFAPSLLRTVMAGKGAEIDVRIVLPGAGGSVRGRVVDVDGRGVPGAEVKVGNLGWATRVITLPDGSRGHVALAATTETDIEGRFEVQGLPPGDNPIRVRADDFAAHEGTVKVLEQVHASATVLLQHGATCVGTVRDEKGGLLGGIEVTHGSYESSFRRATRSEQDGTYRLTGLPAGMLELSVRTENRGSAKTELQFQPGEATRWDVTLARGFVLAGTLTNDKGKPVPEAYVEAMGPSLPGGKPWFRFVVADANGKFELTGVPRDATIELTIQAREHERIPRLKVETNAGDLQLQMKHLGKPTARVIGLLVDPDGKPVASAQVSLVGGGGGILPTTKEGKILIERQHPGQYSLRVRAGAYPSYRSEVFELKKGGTHDLGRVQLVRGGHIRVDMTRPGKTSFFVSLYKPDGRTRGSGHFTTTTDPIRSEPIAPGDYLVRIGGKTIVQRELPVTVRAGQESVLEVAVQVGRTCEFLFDLPAPLADRTRIQVTVSSPQTQAARLSAYKHRDGRYRCYAGLPAGKFRLQATTEAGYSGAREFEVVAGEVGQTFRTALK